jgi:TonB family protein
MSRKLAPGRRPAQFAFAIADAPRLPLTGEQHPLRREFARWMTWANATTLLACLAVFGAWTWWSHRETPSAPITRQVKIVRYADLGVPPSLARASAPQVSVAQAVSEIVAPPPTIAVPEPVADELAQAQTIASASEVAAALAPVSLDDLNLAAGDSVVGGIAPVEAAPQEIIFESTQVDEAPEVVTKTPPVYPHDAREQGLEGYVAVKLLVDADGSVRQVNILKSKPDGVFDEAVGQAAGAWVFKPGKIGGKPVPTWVMTTLQFRLN